MKAAKHMGGKFPTRASGGPMIDKGREEEKENEMEDGHKKGGRVKRRDGGAAEGTSAPRRMDRPGRKRGGGVGSDKRPLSSAANEKDADGHSGGANETAPS